MESMLYLVIVPAGSSCDPPPNKCNPKDFFPTYDGSCNNLERTNLGQAGTTYDRMFKSGYADGKHKMRVSVVDGSPLPSARLLRTTFLSDRSVPSKKYTPIAYAMGQFVTHDLTSFNALVLPTSCCTPQGQKTIPQPKGCIPIEVPTNDRFYSHFNVTCLSMTRANSSYDARCNMDKPSTPFNFVSGYLDQSMVYSSDKSICDSLRTMEGGELKIYDNKYHQSFFSITEPCPVLSTNCMAVGDQRVVVCPELFMCTTIFVRFHNVMASAFRFIAKHLNDQQIFDRTRRIVIACLQNTFYGEYLPATLGVDMCKKYNLLPLKYGYTTYDSKINGQTFLEFTITTRLGHSLVLNGAKWRGLNGVTRSYELKNQFLDQTFLLENKTFPNLLQTYQKVGCNKPDNHEVSGISNHLFQQNGKYGSDLEASDLQRARDMGMLDYNSVRCKFGEKPLENFEDLRDIIEKPQYIKELKKLYKSVHDLDYYLMISLEKHIPGTAFGPTGGKVVARSCHASKFGDRFYFEHAGWPAFSLESLDIIRQIKLSHIICWTNAMTPDLQIPKNAYELPSANNEACSCAQMMESAPDLAKLARLMAKEGFPKKSHS